MEKVASPLALEGWLDFNRETWGVSPKTLRLHLHGAGLPWLEAILFLDKRGRICTPPLTPYTVLSFHPTPTDQPHHASHQWLQLADVLVQEMRHLGLSDHVLLPPEIVDVRPWQWAGFLVQVRYTLEVDFPYDVSLADRSVRNRARKALKEGYRCDRTDKMADILAPLRATAERKSIAGRLSLRDLERGRELMGPESFRTYACYSPEGKPVSAHIILFAQGTQAMDWLAGTESVHLHCGVAQLLTRHILDDLQASGGTGLDFVGANVPAVSLAKANWGGRVKPCYWVEPYGLRLAARFLRAWWRFHAPCPKLTTRDSVAPSLGPELHAGAGTTHSPAAPVDRTTSKGAREERI